MEPQKRARTDSRSGLPRLSGGTVRTSLSRLRGASGLGLAAFSADLATDQADLLGEVLLDYLPPDQAAFTILVGTFFEPGKLRAPLANEGVEPQEFRFKFDCPALFAFHDPIWNRRHYHNPRRPRCQVFIRFDRTCIRNSVRRASGSVLARGLPQAPAGRLFSA